MVAPSLNRRLIDVSVGQKEFMSRSVGKNEETSNPIMIEGYS